MNIKRIGCVLILAIWLIPVMESQAREKRSADIDGLHGELHVFGGLTEAACRLDMTSAWQEVNLGSTPNSDLRQPGDKGTPIPFTLKFRDCLRTKGAVEDRRNGNLTWNQLQPVVTVSFVAPADRDYPHLVRVTGITGLGLQITDSANNDIRLGERGRPRFAAAGQDSLEYYVTPVRTPRALGIGQYRAVVDFRVNYD
ncbi:fimbrial protein [Photorhabdus luminescens subsp. luminescens]|uniref:Pilin (Type 1 fimbria component protein) n=1 Tax=Photorhabdus luminescens TaxID=29488 RepID=A0A1G5QKL2_PHOLU|nr:fimbrial protein [Photorhabdus luminescens]KMW73559.1 fimbrial protein [Photorhabdus luminescens subsp. luminescens]SCZ61689.1 Pilin (type 1 fimbria component protein) [Photorhabdus luminescens]